MASGDESLPQRRWPLGAALALLAVGIGLAIHLLQLKLKFEFPALYPDFRSVCAIGSGWSCEAVQGSDYASIFGVPVALLAVPTYLVMGLLAVFGLRRDARAGAAVSYLAGIGVLTVLYSAWLAWISHYRIGAFCLFCFGLYGVNLGVTVLAFVARGRTPVATLGEALGSLVRGAAPVLPAATLMVVTGLAGWVVYDGVHESMLEAAEERARAQLEEARGDGESADEDGSDGAGSGGGGEDDSEAEETAVSREKPEPERTDNGVTWYEIPVDEDDYVKGPEDAPVTVVTFKDFECNFCRWLTKQQKPLEERYEGKVRWVFKHYPMNGNCNYRLGNEVQHEHACQAARAGHCAHEQDRFFGFRKVLFDNQRSLSEEKIRGHAEDFGLDMEAFDECMDSTRPDEKIREDVKLAARMRIIGTPRIYVNNRLVTGSMATEVLDYYIQDALEHPLPPEAVEPKEPGDGAPRQVQVDTSDGSVWVDAFEASIDQQGRAVSLPGVEPAKASWFDAREACREAGKRLCTVEEWMSACTGAPAVDDDGDGELTDDDLEGRLYPYGAYYEKGRCRDAQPETEGSPTRTGSNPGCRTPADVYDLTGNLYEWVGRDEEAAAQMGGDWRSESSASCRQRNTTYGPGLVNRTTGFRCCSGEKVTHDVGPDELADTSIPDIVGQSVPKDLDLETHDGARLDPSTFEGKVTYLTFFASWCSNCRKQMPAIDGWQEKWGDEGFQVVGIDVDRDRSAGERYVEQQLEPSFSVAYDPSAKSMDDFEVNAMPTSFVVGKDGVIDKRIVGFQDGEIEETKTYIRDLLDDRG